MGHPSVLGGTVVPLLLAHFAPVIPSAVQISILQLTLNGEHCATTASRFEEQIFGQTPAVDDALEPSLLTHRAPMPPLSTQTSVVQNALSDEHCATTAVKSEEHAFGHTILGAVVLGAESVVLLVHCTPILPSALHTVTRHLSRNDEH